MKRLKNIQIGLLTSLVLVTLASCEEDDKQTLDNPPEQNSINIGTHTLETYSQINDTENLIVFESGLGNGHSVWFLNHILDEIGEESDVLLYDRAGYENSEIGPGPRTIEQLSFELEQVVAPYLNGRKMILVSHSIGGFIARDYTLKNPDNVEALLFIDPSHESYNNPGQDGEDLLYDLMVEMYGEVHGAPMEARSLIENIAYASTLADLPNIPITVLTSMKEDEGNITSDELNGGSRQIWYDAHKELGEGISDFVHIPTTQSGHYIMIDEPNLVIEEIQKLMAK